MADNCQSSESILYTPNARLVFNRLSGVAFNTQSVVIPGFSINEAQQFTSMFDVNRPGEKMTFEPFVVSFIVNEDLANWQAVYDWMFEIASPKDFNDRLDNYNDMISDASIVFLTNTGSPLKTIKLIDAWPMSMSGLPMNLNESPEPVIADLTVAYSYFEIQRDDC